MVDKYYYCCTHSLAIGLSGDILPAVADVDTVLRHGRQQLAAEVVDGIGRLCGRWCRDAFYAGGLAFWIEFPCLQSGECGRACREGLHANRIGVGGIDTRGEGVMVIDKHVQDGAVEIDMQLDGGAGTHALVVETARIETVGKDVVVVETSWAWTTGWKDEKTNVFYTEQEKAGAEKLTELRTSGGTAAATKYGQKAVLASIIESCKRAGGIGVFYWGGDWISCDNVLSSWENQALFDFEGKITPAAEAFLEN